MPESNFFGHVDFEVIAANLEIRADNDENGGWSTVHVEPMRELSLYIWARIGRKKPIDVDFAREIANKFDNWHKEVIRGSWSTQNKEWFLSTANSIYMELGRR